jgi:hypothetical protein
MAYFDYVMFILIYLARRRKREEDRDEGRRVVI